MKNSKMVEIKGYVPKSFFTWLRKNYSASSREEKVMLKLVQIEEVQK